MKKVVCFGNCQADAAAQVLRAGLSEPEFSIEFVSNNPRTGGMKDPETVLGRIAVADVLLFQPLRHHHGSLAEENVRSVARGRMVTFPYLFNSGIAALCHAPPGDRRPLTFFGDEPIIEMLDAGATEDDVVSAYEQGEIDFRLPQRFEACMTELRSRETKIDIRVADSIAANYRETQQFLAHNHPTAALLLEICAQLKDLTGLPIDLAAIERVEEPLGGGHRCPISPHDAQALGYRFAPTENWATLGRGLLHMICEEHRQRALAG